MKFRNRRCYVGLVTARTGARLGHEVRLGEAERARLALLENGEVPIFEDGLAELIDEARESRRLSFHGSNGEAASGAAMVFLCLPTPPGARGRADLSFIETVIDELALKVDPGTIFVVKSTVPPGTVVGLRNRLANLGSAGGRRVPSEFCGGKARYPTFYPVELSSEPRGEEAGPRSFVV